MKAALACVPLILIAAGCAPVQHASGLQPNRHGAGVPGECVTPASQRPSEMGCYLLAEASVGPLAGSKSYWHVFEYPSVRQAQAAKGQRDTVVQSFGRSWLFRISGNPNEQATGGVLVASVGPLLLDPAPDYTARYMETVSMPGMRTAVHRHSGPEAWYVLSGAQCAATTQESVKAVAGQGAFTPANRVMQMVTIGAVKRRALVLVLHDSRLPWTTMMRDAPNLTARCAS